MYAGSAPVVSLVDKQQTGVWGWLDVQVEFAARFYNLEIKASSNKSSFQICSIHFNVKLLNYFFNQIKKF